MRESRTYGSGRGACDETHVPTATAPGVHHAAWRRGGGMAARGGGAAGGKAAEQRYERAAPHSITSSASESRLSEILTPSTFAVLRLITSSYLVGCRTGRSAGFAPLRIFAV